MLKKSILALLALAASASSFAANYYLVVPVKSRAATAPELAISVALRPVALPDAEYAKPYSFDLKPLLQVTGDPSFDASKVTWSVVSSTLPAGLQLGAVGVIAGTPAHNGQGAITVRASYKSKSGEQTYQLLTVGLTVTLGTGSLPAMVAGTAYTYDFKQLLQVQGPKSYNPADVAWTLAAGALPAGLTLGADGVLAGTPTDQVDSVPLSVKATYQAKTAQADYVLYQNDLYWNRTVALLRMDGTNGGTTFSDEKGGTYRAVGATTSTAAGKFNESGYFTGAGGKGVTGPAINLPADFTIEAWVNPKSDGMSGFRVIAGQWSQQLASSDAYLFGISNGQLQFHFGPYSVYGPMITGGSVPANTWSHVAATRQGSKFRIFINGSMVASGDSTLPGPTITLPTTVGDFYGPSGTFGWSGGLSFSGYIDELRITTASRYNANFTPPAGRFPAR